MKKNYTLIVIALFLYIPQAFAQFSLSGSTITQTGTAANLDNIQNKADAYEEYSFPTLQSQTLTYRRATLNGRNLLTQGTMTLNPDPDALNQDELLLAPNSPNNTITVQNGGELILGGYVTNKDLTTRVANGTALRAFMRAAEFYRDGGILVQNGGKFTQIGATLLTDTVFRVVNGGTVDVTEGTWASTVKHTTRAGATGPYFRLETNNITINGLKVTGQNLNIVTQDLSPISISGLSLEEARLTFQGTNPVNSWTTVEDFEGFIGGGSLFVWAQRFGIKLLNAKNGGNTPISPVHSANNNGSLVETAATVKFIIADATGSPIQNALVYGKAVDHILPGAILVPTGFDYPNQNGLYNELTNASGETNAFEVKINYSYQDGTGTGGSGNRVELWRSNTDNSEDFALFSFNHDIAEVNVDLLGTGRKDIRWTLFDDLDITETNKPTVDAYAVIDNLDQLYDRAKSWKVDNVGLEYPAVGEQLIDGNGTVLDVGNRNLVIDANAGSAFAVNQGANTITIKAASLVPGNRFKSIKTTGTISLQNGAELKTGYEDSSGTFVYLELTNLDQQTILVTDQQNPGSPVTLLNIPSTSGTYANHFQLPAGGEINVLVERSGYAPWTETIPDEDLNFVREVSTSLSAITAENQIKTIDLLIKLLQKTETVINTTNNQSLPVPTISVSTTTTAISAGPSVDNQEAELALLRRILAKMTAVRETVNKD